jgi:signal transduction histidine kinase
VERLTQNDRVSAIAAAAAHDLNDELTIILNGAHLSIEALEPGHPARHLLRDIEGAAQRCVWKTSGLLNYGARRGMRPVPIPMERLMLESD